jgi:hypothetical protein
VPYDFSKFMPHDFYTLFSAYWWLLIPAGWAIFRMLRLVLEHKRAAQALELIKTYTDQGKEIPPDLLRVLQQPEQSARRSVDPKWGLTIIGLLMAALAVAFLVLLVMLGIMEGDHETTAGLSFVTVLFAGVSIAFLLTARLRSKEKQLDPP